MQIKVKIIEDSISPDGVRLTTFQLDYPRFILAELNTHRVFSRSSKSSRAIPVIKLIKEIWNAPYIPEYWGENISGMQAKSELSGIKLILSKFIWKLSSKFACIFSYILYKLNLHKQISNRILEPWMLTSTVVTSTEWNNFFELRCHPDAQPEFQKLANLIREQYFNNNPTLLEYGDWHLPYVTEIERQNYDIKTCVKMSTARCARVSYNNHDGTNCDVNKDILLHDTLIVTEPKHASPAEHQAQCNNIDKSIFIKNFRQWNQYRNIIEKL